MLDKFLYLCFNGVMKSLKEVADELGITKQAVIYRIKTRGITVRRIGTMYAIDARVMKLLTAKRQIVYR